VKRAKGKKKTAAPLLCAAGKHEVGHPSLPCEACADEEVVAVHRLVTIPAEDVTQVQSALRSVRQFLELVKAPLVGSDEYPTLPVSEVIAAAKAAEQRLQSALLESLKQS
jgi:hypothetical protein